MSAPEARGADAADLHADPDQPEPDAAPSEEPQSDPGGDSDPDANEGFEPKRED